MQTTMPASPVRAERRSTQIPKLLYRSSPSIDPSQLSPQFTVSPRSLVTADPLPSTSYETKTKPPSIATPTIAPSSQLRPTSTIGSDRSPTFKPVVLPLPQKKKGLFGGIFVTKEPTALALERLAAQLEAQHGELSARAIPGVSSSKLPQHVPKVNSKWDGVPEALKERDRLQKEKARAAKRHSLAQSTRSRSVEGSRQARTQSDEQQTIQKRSSISTLSSFDSRGRAGHQGESQSLSNSSIEVHSNSNSSISHGDRAERIAKALSTKSQSLRSPSGSSLPLITSFFPNDIPSPPPIPTRLNNESNTKMNSSDRSRSTDHTRCETNDTGEELNDDLLPDHSSSPVGTPPDQSPVTPSPISTDHTSVEPAISPTLKHLEENALVSTTTDILSLPQRPIVRRKFKSKEPGHAFLAGEAQPLQLPEDHTETNTFESDLPFRRESHLSKKAPELPAHARRLQSLEKRPDSSRERLGLRASMLVRTEQTPWELEDPQQSVQERSISPRLTVPNGSKRMSKILGKASK